MMPVVPVSFSCRYFGIARSTFYYRKKDKTRASLKTKQAIQDAIKKSFEASKGTYGAPRVHKDLLEQEFSVSENTVAKYMHELGFDARLKKSLKSKQPTLNTTARLRRVQSSNILILHAKVPTLLARKLFTTQ